MSILNLIGINYNCQIEASFVKIFSEVQWKLVQVEWDQANYSLAMVSGPCLVPNMAVLLHLVNIASILSITFLAHTHK